MSTRIGKEVNWKHFVHGLSGMFCSSLNFLDLESPLYSSGIIHKNSNEFDDYYVGSLSKESVCTENLTPFKSMIPTNIGLVELLNPLKLFDTHYSSFVINFQREKLKKIN